MIMTAKNFLTSAKPPHVTYFKEFATSTTSSILRCFTNQKSTHAEKEYICTRLHTLWTSSAWHNSWSTFLQKFTGTNPGTTFYQHITLNILRRYIDEIYNQTGSIDNSTQPTIKNLTNIEENILRYFAGYICHKITKKLLISTHPNKNALLFFMSELNGNEENTDNATEEWTNEVDRGGLTHINDTTYAFFYQVEIELRNFYNIKQVIREQSLKSDIIQKISENDNVLYYWHNITEDESQLLLIDEVYTTIITEYVTVRGFYFANSIVEAYKVLSKRNVSKSKGLRKTILV